jgi:hypothetical protein
MWMKGLQFDDTSNLGVGGSMRKKRQFIIGLMSCVILSVKCAQSTFVVTGKSYEPWAGNVQIFQESPNDLKYEEIGWVTGKMAGSVSDWGKILKSMQETARNNGANAIILVNKETSNHASVGGSLQYGFYGGSYQEKTIMAKAIRIIEKPGVLYPTIIKISKTLILFEDSNQHNPGERLTVKRGAVRIGEIEVLKVRGKLIACKVISQSKENIQIGDVVITDIE